MERWKEEERPRITTAEERRGILNRRSFLEKGSVASGFDSRSWLGATNWEWEQPHREQRNASPVPSIRLSTRWETRFGIPSNN